MKIGASVQQCGWGLRAAPPRASSRPAFSLVELLVVIGIIALLFSILLPSLARAREDGRRATCMSNLRQLGAAFMMYVNENKGHFPRASPRGPIPQVDWDWIFWEKQGPRMRDVNESAIAPYLGVPVNENVLRCPSDNFGAHRPDGADPATGTYPYSYTFNGLFNPWWGERAIMTMVHDSSNKIMLVDEDESWVNDGHWQPPPQSGGQTDWLAIRHDRARQLPDLNQPANMDRRGNAAFADGHVEFIPRSEAYDPHYNDPLQ